MDILGCVTKLNIITAILMPSFSEQSFSTPRHVHIVLVTENATVEERKSLCRGSLYSPKERQRIQKPTSNLILWHFKWQGEMCISMTRQQQISSGQAILERAQKEFFLYLFVAHKKKLHRVRRSSDCFPDTIVIRPHGILSAQ